MSSFIRMQPVIEVFGYEGEFLCPWEIPEFNSFSMIRLGGEMTYPQIGLFVAQLAIHNQIELVDNKQVVIEQILQAKSLILPGGIQVVGKGKKTVSPGCCCGLETWRQWIDFLKIGQSPWLGHDPSPWVEMQGDVIRIWSDGRIKSIKPIRNTFHIDVSRSVFKKNLTKVEQDLQGFLFCIENWAAEIGVIESSKLVQKFDECFRITKSDLLGLPMLTLIE